MANNTNWLNISSQSGSSGQTILTLSANKNLSTNYKTAEITAYNPVYNISAKTYVTLESYAPILSISPGLFGVPDSGGTYELTISANCAWVIAFPDLVTSYSTTAGTGNAVVTFTVPGTTADTTLVGNIVVTDESGQVSRTARVEQYGSGVHISIFPVELYFDSTGGSQTFSVTADAAYNVSVGSGTDWAFVEPHSGYTGQTTFTVTVNSENTGTTDKQGVINIDAPGQDLAVILYHKKPETRVVATYYVTSTTKPTKILSSTNYCSKAEYPDGTEITLGTGYTFPTTGYQTIYYTLTGSTVGGFQQSTALTSVVIPKGVTEIVGTAFANCSGLTSVTIPNTVTQLGIVSFNSCTSLSSITLPDSLQAIADSAFKNCTSLASITIPSGVASIGQYCFTGSSVSSITFTSLVPPTLGNTNALSSSTLSEIIVPCPAVNDYITAWPQYAQYISCSETGTTLYFTTNTSNVKGTGETRTITILNTNINPNRTGLNLPSDFPQQGSYVVDGNVIYLTYPANPSSSATRSWTIGVVGQTNDGVSLSGSYQITQDANTTYSIPYTADTSTVDASGETRTITIDTSNLVASSITIGAEGATGVTTSYSNGVITVVFPNNPDSTRDIVVSVVGKTTGNENATAAIIFPQAEHSRVPIPYTADTSTVPISGATRTITIDTTGLVSSSITVNVVGATGISYTYNNGTVILTFPNNTGDAKRVYVEIEGERLDGNYGYANIAYTQRGEADYLKPLSFNVISSGTIYWKCSASATVRTIEYRKNYGEWTTITSNTGASAPSISVSAGDVVQFRGNNATYSTNNIEYCSFDSSIAKFELEGNIMSLIDSTNFATATTLASSYTFNHLFANCTGLTSAENLLLPATTLAVRCYLDMFLECTSLTQAPELPATTLTNYCYYGMFQTCTSLTSAPELPATTLADYCYNSMFQSCTRLTTAPELPVTTLADNCYGGMFWGCTSLTTAPELPATTLADYCYEGMFGSCTSLTAAPELPATTLAGYCYFQMFYGCRSLTTAPVLPATTLASHCYYDMFSFCTSLSSAPALPATTLANYCYYEMFWGCTSLTTAPVLSATNLVFECYYKMFLDCNNLNYIKCLATDISAFSCVAGWVYGVAGTGTFVTPSSTSWSTGADGIPSGWTRVNSDT